VVRAIGTLLRDAGAKYCGDDTTNGSISLSWKEVLDKAVDAEYWVNVFRPRKLMCWREKG